MNRDIHEITHENMLAPYLGECTVILKQNGDFPISCPCKVALFGNGARHTVKGGTGSGEVNSHYFPSIEEALTHAGFTITTTTWLDAYDCALENAKTAFRKEIKRLAREHHTLPMFEGMGAVMPEPEYDIPFHTTDRESDDDTIALYVLSRCCGEGNDRQPIPGDFCLTNTEINTILALHKTYHKFLLVLNVGAPIDLSPVMEVSNILLLSWLGATTSNVLCDILLGKTTPSGRLATSWPTLLDFPKLGTFGDVNDTLYTEGLYVGYRYYDSSNIKPLFPFGYGLSTTQFYVYGTTIARNSNIVTLHTNIQNIGSFTGKEVLFLFVSCPGKRFEQPYQVLAGWMKTNKLEPGERQMLTLSFPLADIATFDTKNRCMLLEEGEYLFRLGRNSQDTTLCGTFTLTEELILEHTSEALNDSLDVSDNEKTTPSETKYDYEHPSIPTEIDSLSDKQLAHLLVGSYRQGLEGLSVIGNASNSVAGAAGETNQIPHFLAPIVMADGPAGLRLSSSYFIGKKGPCSLGMSFPESVVIHLPKWTQWLLSLAQPKPNKHQEILHQYATAIPVGTALAQSFNLEFATLCGSIVGKEMELFGVDLWLAPALNLHRNVLCGRNFEYYSEDPIVSGLFAAAITKGVQSSPNKGVTIKHYAANNQETNRYLNNSQVEERVLRELYLRGFKICIRESSPKAIMSSYNLLNGVHTNESYDLITGILRHEWNYTGMIMTDWIIAGTTFGICSPYRSPRADRVIASGHDLFMPGSKKDEKHIAYGLAHGLISRKQAKESITRLYEFQSNK